MSFRPPRLKICGITRPEDAVLAAAAGAEACGFVHHPPSPRSVARTAARAAVSALPPEVLPVAVLVDAAPAAAERFCAGSGCRAVQLCGGEQAGDWTGFPLPILRRLGVAAGAEEEVERWLGIAAAFVLDHPAAPGGTGRTVDLGRAARLAALAPCLLAGGLGPDTVAAAVAAVRPYGVDASSRLESAPGRKDPAALRRFAAAARSALGLDLG